MTAKGHAPTRGVSEFEERQGRDHCAGAHAEPAPVAAARSEAPLKKAQPARAGGCRDRMTWSRRRAAVSLKLSRRDLTSSLQTSKKKPCAAWDARKQEPMLRSFSPKLELKGD